ncbi:hypothetical protein FHS68_004859 [Dyadobacter arcticus]|uniref:DUF4369 domain-containing protein n=1 Tax=Dyadobacter arcticus TaxID=1078754 RepID=A0ABX0UV57_9BACT|nr:hypothetical protein [Dyadobacter arcticus]
MIKNLTLIALLIFILACESSDTDLINRQSGNSPVETKGNFVTDRRASNYSNPFKISAYDDIYLSPIEYRFTIQSLPSIVNGYELNLHGLTFRATNVQLNVFGLEGKIYGRKRSIRIDYLLQEVFYKIDEVEYLMNAEFASKLSDLDRLGFITLFSILADRTDKDLIRSRNYWTRVQRSQLLITR